MRRLRPSIDGFLATTKRDLSAARTCSLQQRFDGTFLGRHGRSRQPFLETPFKSRVVACRRPTRDCILDIDYDAVEFAPTNGFSG